MYMARLVNSPAQDPALLLTLAEDPASYLIDCGTLHNLSTRDLLRVRKVFVTHLHIDHFCGFDHLIRMQLFSRHPLDVYGPPGTAACVGAKLAGYTWNLVSSSEYEVRAHEIPDGFSTSFLCRTGFSPTPCEYAPVSEELGVAPVEHGVPCLAYALRWPRKLSVDRASLRELGLTPGAWLEELKQRSDGEVTVDGQAHSVAELRERLLLERPGPSLAYLTDTLCSKSVMKAAIQLAGGVDELWCEAAYTHPDADKARENLHMTARQAARIAKEAGVRKLHLFHHSRRYTEPFEEHLNEAREVFPETWPPPLYRPEDG